MTLVVAIGYGGQWDIVQAAQRLAARGETIDSRALEHELVTAEWPAPDLLIRTGGEYRISNFMLWQLRSEEHTSELQSLMRISYAVFCLTKQKTKKQSEITITKTTK